jgi:hypothetical protein
MKVIVCKTKKARVRTVKNIILSAGHTIGSVHFRKRSDGSKRRMCYRLHAAKPTYAAKPTGKRFLSRKARDSDNLMLTVLDVNKVRRDKKGKIAGRADWRTVPLETVERICVKGEIYKIKV